MMVGQSIGDCLVDRGYCLQCGKSLTVGGPSIKNCYHVPHLESPPPYVYISENPNISFLLIFLLDGELTIHSALLASNKVDL